LLFNLQVNSATFFADVSKLQVVVVLYPPSVRATLREVIELSPPAVTDGISREIFVHSASLNPTQQLQTRQLLSKYMTKWIYLHTTRLLFDKTI